MQPFLDQLANHLLKLHSENFSRICLVFPSRRAGLFFKQYVSRLIAKPIWLPEIFAIEDFVIHKSGLTLSDPLDLIARLYKVYKSIEKDKVQPFSEFISWGNMLLGDFDEIDQYTADGVKVFEYLDEIKALKQWNPDGKPLTYFEQNYLRFYNSLAPCYKKFREDLLKNNEAYFGLAFDTFLGSIKEISFNEWDRIIFAGFNALTIAEKKLVTVLVESGKADIYWDADDYYLSDTNQEAGRFLREYLHQNTFGPINWVENSLTESKKSLHVIGVPGNVGQAKLAGNLIRETINRKGTANGVALVLVDEGLLLPVLNSIPPETGDFNVTMGFPLNQTPVFSLLTSVITLFVNAKRFSKGTNELEGADLKQLRFYYKDLERFMSHPFILSANARQKVYTIEKSQVLDTKSFYSLAEINELLQHINPALADVFLSFQENKQAEAGNILLLIRNIISFLRGSFSQDVFIENEEKADVNVIESEYLYFAAKICTEIELIANDPELKADIETVLSLVTTLVSGMRLPFYGEPLNGLQVMGMLETRLLDFTDIIMISVNEGLLPRGKQQSTFIPDEVRTHFGMPRYTERTAVFAYHFYRLLQRVENAWLIYNTEGDELGGGEKSRFISQLIQELPKRNPKLEITEQTLSVSPHNTANNKISIDKTPDVLARLKQLAERGLSPTAIAMYHKCKLWFYFNQVLGLSEIIPVSDTIDAAKLGEIVHEVLFKLYRSRKGIPITPDTLTTMMEESVSLVQKAISSELNAQESVTGKNLLIMKVAENMVKRCLLTEKKHLEETGEKIEILMLEENLETELQISDNITREFSKVKIHGKADRIDMIGSITRIIDYKTGKVDPRDLKLDHIQNIFEKDDPAKLLQVLMYALMYCDMSQNRKQSLVSGIISLRKTSAYLMKTDISKVDIIDPDLLKIFKIELESIVGSIFSISEPFDQTANIETCKLCSFNTICNRTVN